MRYMEIAPIDEHFIESFFDENNKNVLKLNDFKLLEDTNSFDNPAQAIGYFFYNIKNSLTGEYELRYKEYKKLGKEINDLYAKIEDIISHDKVARYKHRNDLCDFEAIDVIRFDKSNPKKYFIANYDILLYDPEQIGKSCDQWISNIKKEKEEKHEALIATYLAEISATMYSKHNYLDQEVMLKISKYKNVKLEKILQYFKVFIENEYATSTNCNTVLSNELIYSQAVEKYYRAYSARHVKESKEIINFIDSVFKEVIMAMSKSMGYNSRVMNLNIKCLKNFASQLEKFYDIIRA